MTRPLCEQLSLPLSFTNPKHDCGSFLTHKCVVTASCSEFCDPVIQLSNITRHDEKLLLHNREAETDSDKQGAELNISSPNSAMNNSNSINKTLNVSINADPQSLDRPG